MNSSKDAGSNSRRGKVIPIDKIPPHDDGAERAVLSAAVLVSTPSTRDETRGSLLSSLDSAFALLRAEHFYSEANRKLFEVVLHLRLIGRHVDTTTVLSELRARNLLQVVPPGYLVQVVCSSPALSHVNDHAAIVHRLARRRELMASAKRIAEEGYLDVGDEETWIRKSVEEVTSIATPTGEGGISRLIHPVTDMWLGSPPPPRKYLAHDTRNGKGALPAKGVALLAAAGGLGKSFVVNALAIAVATGGALFGTFAVDHPGRVLVISGEDDHEEIRRRLYYVAGAVDVRAVPERSIEILDAHDQPVGLLDRESQRTDDARALGDYLRARGPFDLVVFDPLARFAGAAQIDKDSNAGASLVACLESFASAAKGLVLGIHHTSLMARRNAITDATALRGVTSISDSGRMTLLLSASSFKHPSKELNDRLGRIATLSCVKSNYGTEWEPVELRRGDHGELYALDETDRDIVSKTRSKSDPKAKAAEVAKLREEQRKARDEADVARKRAKEIDAQETRRKRFELEDGALLEALRAHPEGLGLRAVRAAMAAALGSCSHSATDIALVRAGDRIEASGLGNRLTYRVRKASDYVLSNT